MKTVGREIMWNLPPWAASAMYALFGVVVLVASWAVARKVEAWRRGRPEREDRLDDPCGRIRDVLAIALGQRKVLERRGPGLVHLAIYAAFLVLFAATCLVALEYDFGVPILDGRFYVLFKVAVNAFGLLLLLGVAAALLRRCVLRPPGLTRDGDDLLQLLLIGAIGITGFLVEASRLAATSPRAAPASFVGHALAPLFAGLPVAKALTTHRALWWTHLLLAFGFLASIPLSKMIHLGTGTASVFLRSSRPKGALQTVPDIEEEEAVGVAEVTDFSWKQLLSADGCTKCGRCQDECPAHAAGMALSPRDVVLKTRDAIGRDLYEGLVPSAAAVDRKTGKAVRAPFAREVLTPDEIWACTTCRACMQACPVLIEHIDMIVDVRRGYVAGMTVPDTARKALRKMGDTGNPWGLPRDDRLRWAASRPVPLASEKKTFEYLWWIGCAGAYDPRNQRVTRTIASLLDRAGVDYAVLGPEETCCGESARRLGEEGLFQLGMVPAVREVFEGYGVRKVITQCPHCYNTFRNEYPRFGVSVEVVHHTVFLRDLLARGALVPRKPVNRRVAVHDSCYLGRHNDLFEAPRQILGALPGLSIAEPSRTRERAFCCGAGGGAMWLEVRGGRINHLRFDQLLATGAGATASACPYCLTMFDDAVKFRDLDDAVAARDVAELLSESL